MSDYGDTFLLKLLSLLVFRDKNSSSNMKIDTLAFVHCLLVHHSGEVFHPHIGELLPPVVTCVADPFYKITAEALLVLQQIVKVIRPLGMQHY